MRLSTIMCVSEETKAKLERIKRDGETFEEQLLRLAEVEDGMAESAGA